MRSLKGKGISKKNKKEVSTVSLDVRSVADTQSRTPAHSRPHAVLKQPGVRDCTLYSCMRLKYECKTGCMFLALWNIYAASQKEHNVML